MMAERKPANSGSQPNATRSRAIPMALGAAQLGMKYGIANRIGQPTAAESDAILMEAFECGIRWIDTAASYGESESRIGSFLRRHPSLGKTPTSAGLQIVSKLAGDVNPRNTDSVLASVEMSVERLGQPLDSVLLHNATHIQAWNDGLSLALFEARKRGWVQTLGVSVYSPEEFEQALEIEDLQFIQLPLNVFDHRWSKGHGLKRAGSLGKTLFIRSVLLQGLLVMDPVEAARKHPLAAPYLEEWRRLCYEFNRSPAEMAVAFVRSVVPDAQLILGCETRDQVTQNAALFAGAPLSDKERNALSRFSHMPAAIYDPRVWPKPETKSLTASGSTP